jgi:choline monooxygenase
MQLGKGTGEVTSGLPDDHYLSRSLFSLMGLLDFKFDDRISRAETLPSNCYLDPAALSLERQRLFFRTWQLVGRLDQVAEPGSYFTTEILDEPILVVRDLNGELRAFHNVCRHRAGQVARGSGCRRVFQCGYHGWTYSLDGRLLGTPDWDGVEDFRREEVSLVPLALQTWERFIFVKIGKREGEIGGAELSDLLGDIPQATGHCRISSMSFVARRDYVIGCNWKVYVDNYVEGYHVPIVHPSLMRELDYERYRTITHRFYSRQDAPIRTGDGEGRRYQPTDEQSEALYFWIFPNLMLNIYPDNLSTNLILPLGVDRTLTIFEWYFHEPEAAGMKERIEQTIALSDEVQQEDISVCEAVQRGLKSISYERGRYSVKRENGVHHFHALWRECLLSENNDGS